MRGKVVKMRLEVSDMRGEAGKVGNLSGGRVISMRYARRSQNLSWMGHL